MILSQLIAVLREHRALIVHFSHTSKEGASLLFPDDLKMAIQIVATKELSCSVVWPQQCEAVGSVGVVLRPKNLSSVTSASADDAGTLVDQNTGKRQGLGEPLTDETLRATFGAAGSLYTYNLPIIYL